MRNAVAVALIIMGGLVILGPVAAQAYSSTRDKERVAEFYSRNSNAAVLPQDLRPASYGVYDFGCWLAGVGMVIAGLVRARAASPAAVV